MKTLAIGAAAAAAITIALVATGYAQNTKPPGYLIANYTIKDQAGPLAPKYGGKIIVFNLNATSVEGQPKSVMAIAEFPTLADAQRFYNSPEYTAARKFRVASTEGTVVITEGFVPPQP
jgi:uncharacterized protein (DUF1330 family)